VPRYEQQTVQITVNDAVSAKHSPTNWP